MPTIKIKDLTHEKDTPCSNLEHDAPGMFHYEPGIYRHTCPGCGRSYEFTVNGYTN